MISAENICLPLSFLLALAGILFFTRSENQPEVTVTARGIARSHFDRLRECPKSFPIPDGDLKDSVIAAGDYLMRQQLPNGELSYQVDFMSGERAYSPSHVRLMSGTGALFTVCRVSGDLELLPRW